MLQHSPLPGVCVSWPQPSRVHHCSSASDLAAAVTAAHSDPAAWQLLPQLLWRLHHSALIVASGSLAACDEHENFDLNCDLNCVAHLIFLSLSFLPDKHSCG